MIARRRRNNRLLAAALLALAGGSLWTLHGGANAKPATGLQIVHPWSRPAAAGGVGAGYFTILNPGRTADRLLRVESAGADAVGLHVSLAKNGVMSMDEVKGGVRVEASGRVDFQPGGLHVMFVGLKKAQKLGDVLPATLVFQRAGRIEVAFKVETGAPAKPMNDMPH